MDELRLDGRTRTPTILQAEASECGLACLAMVCASYGHRTDIGVLRQSYPSSSRGVTAAQIIETAGLLGFSARALRGEIEDLADLTLPAILHWNLNHYVVLDRVRTRGGVSSYAIIDPASGRRWMNAAAMSRHFTGVVVEMVRTSAFKSRNVENRLKISQLWSSMRGFGRSFGTVLGLACVIQLAVLVTPFYSQIAIDSILPSADTDLLKVLAGGFLLVAVFQLLSNWLRGAVIVALNNALAYQVSVNLTNHLLRLPVSWFERRHVGDVVSRFQSTIPISQLLSQGMIAALVDGVLSIITLVVMFVYSRPLALVALGALLWYIAVRVVFVQALKVRNIDVITTAAKENSYFIETVRGISTLKAFGREKHRLRLWQQTKADAVNAEIRLGRLSSGFDAVGLFIPSAERVIFLFVGIGLVLDGAMTLGMIFAFQAYKQYFLDSSFRFVEQAINYNLIHVHLNRISDIALSKPETGDEDGRTRQFDLQNSIFSIRDLRFRYSPQDPEILSGVSLDIPPGEMVALIGPSGGGKTTLLRLMMGVLEPTHGDIHVGQDTLKNIASSAWRGSIGSVAQDDVLFAGSIGQNIAFFDPDRDLGRIYEVARIACIHDEIIKMPLGYDTLVGDMGSSLSGGQRQRILLARALYGKPDILFLDEGTANLDPESEARIIGALRDLKITRVMVAHRPLSIEAADRVFLIHKGRAIPQISKSVSLAKRTAPDLPVVGAAV